MKVEEKKTLPPPQPDHAVIDRYSDIATFAAALDGDDVTSVGPDIGEEEEDNLLMSNQRMSLGDNSEL